jgi:putative transposase
MPSGLKRYQQARHAHFITFSCYHRLPYLDDDHARTVFLQTLETLRTRHLFRIYGFVLMPEHVHLLLSEPEACLLSDTLRALKTQTSKLLKRDRTQFWQRRYYDFNVFSEDKFPEKTHYMHWNPVLRGLVERPEDWPWSSHGFYHLGTQTIATVTSHFDQHRIPGAGRPIHDGLSS